MKLSIIIVTYSSLNYLKTCLDSINKQTFLDYELIIIDNNSIDGGLEFIKKEYPKIKTLKNIRNIGLAKANNQGIKLARGEYVLIMNPDIILEKKYWIARAVKFADRYFEGDIKKMTYCLKDVYDWKLWTDLSREYKKVPWEDFHEDENNTTLAETVACAGGVCEL